MKTYLAAVAMLMASTAAHAGSSGNAVSFQIDGQQVRIQVPKNCDTLSCIQVSAPGLSKSGFNLKGLGTNKSDDDAADANPPAAQASKPQAPVAQTAAPQMSPPAVNNTSPAPTTVASTAPAPVLHDVVPGDPAPAPAAAVAPVTAAPRAPQSAAVAALPAAAPTTPIGVWNTEENKGNVRIEPCGANLCGYAVGSGDKILINMKPEDSKWVGRIHDPDSGKDYDSTIAMKGANTLKVQGCAFGGLFCGGQTWKRVS